MANSATINELRRAVVVNCFQISNFVLWQTADATAKQGASCCELLSN